MKSYPEVQEENPWGCIFFFRLLPFLIPWEKTAQLYCGSTYGKRQNQDRNIFLIALMSLGDESQCQ